MTRPSVADAPPQPPGAADPRAPAGFRYEPAFLTADDERALLAAILDVAPGRWRTSELVRTPLGDRCRRAAYFGWDRYTVSPLWRRATPMPSWLLALRDRCERFAGVPAGRFEQAVVLAYPPDTGIGAHTDAPEAFEEPVVVVSVNAPCRLMLRDPARRESTPCIRVIRPGSAYALTGPARYDWTHEILYERGLISPDGARRDAVRYAVTFRTPLERFRSAADPAA